MRRTWPLCAVIALSVTLAAPAFADDKGANAENPAPKSRACPHAPPTADKPPATS